MRNRSALLLALASVFALTMVNTTTAAYRCIWKDDVKVCGDERGFSPHTWDSPGGVGNPGSVGSPGGVGSSGGVGSGTGGKGKGDNGKGNGAGDGSPNGRDDSTG